MNKFFIIMPVLALSSLVLAGCVGQNKPATSTQPTPASTMSQDTTTTPTESSTTSATTNTTTGDNVTYTLEDVAIHNSKSDCWTVIDGTVYDLSAFLASGKHPGGDQAVAACGKDSTAMFNSRPNDGTAHSSKARAMLPGLAIGQLAK